MPGYKFVVFICLLYVVYVKADKLVCKREPGDELLLSQPLLQIGLLGDNPNLSRNFTGYRITCVETNLPLGLGSLLNLSILNGGVGCDNFGLQIRLGKLIFVGVGVNVYGAQLKPGETTDLTCLPSDKKASLLL